jgi:hypothetical protein
VTNGLLASKLPENQYLRDLPAVQGRPGTCHGFKVNRGKEGQV